MTATCDILARLPVEVAHAILMAAAAASGDPERLMGRLAAVSRRWRAAVRSPGLWAALVKRRSLVAPAAAHAGVSRVAGGHKFIESLSHISQPSNPTNLSNDLDKFDDKFDDAPPNSMLRLRLPSSFSVPLGDKETYKSHESNNSTNIKNSKESKETKMRKIFVFDLVVRPQSVFEALGALTADCRIAPMPLVRDGLRASSSDHRSQGIACTIDNNPHSFWSSAGSNDPDSSEFLVFSLFQPSVVFRIDLTPFCAAFQRNRPTYAPHSVSFAVGFTAVPELMHYVSPQFPIQNIDKSQSFFLEPNLALGTHLLVRLHGRRTRQPGDNLYYTVLQQVQCYGMSIGAIAGPDIGRGNILADLLIGLSLRLGYTDPGNKDDDDVDDSDEDDNINIDDDDDKIPQDSSKSNDPEYIESIRKRLARHPTNIGWIVTELYSCKQFIDRIEADDLVGACEIAAYTSDSSLLRRPGIFQHILTRYGIQPDAPVIAQPSSDNPGLTHKSPEQIYFETLISAHKEMTPHESVILAAHCCHIKSLQLFRIAHSRNLVTLTDDVADVLRDVNLSLSFWIYDHIHSFDNMVDTLIERGEVDRAVMVASTIWGDQIDIDAILHRFIGMTTRGMQSYLGVRVVSMKEGTLNVLARALCRTSHEGVALVAQSLRDVLETDAFFTDTTVSALKASALAREREHHHGVPADVNTVERLSTIIESLIMASRIGSVATDTDLHVHGAEVISQIAAATLAAIVADESSDSDEDDNDFVNE